MEKEVPREGAGQAKNPRAAADQNLSLSEQRKFQVMTELIQWRAKREIINTEHARWSQKQLFVNKHIDALEDELQSLNEGQLVFNVDQET